MVARRVAATEAVRMARRNWFGHGEAAEIKALIDELRTGGEEDARAVRSRLRAEYGFYVHEYVLDPRRMTHGDFDDMVHRGRIRIVDDPDAGVELSDDHDVAFWEQEAGVIATPRTGARRWFPSAQAAEAAGATVDAPTGR